MYRSWTFELMPQLDPIVGAGGSRSPASLPRGRSASLAPGSAPRRTRFYVTSGAVSHLVVHH